MLDTVSFDYFIFCQLIGELTQHVIDPNYVLIIKCAVIMMIMKCVDTAERKVRFTVSVEDPLSRQYLICFFLGLFKSFFLINNVHFLTFIKPTSDFVDLSTF